MRRALWEEFKIPMFSEGFYWVMLLVCALAIPNAILPFVGGRSFFPFWVEVFTFVMLVIGLAFVSIRLWQWRQIKRQVDAP